MRLQLVATYLEMFDKAPDLIKALAGAVRPVHADLAEGLEKALPTQEPKLQFEVLRELHRRSKRGYQDRLQAMLDDVGQVLDRAVVEKSLAAASEGAEGGLLTKAGPFIGPRGGKWADPKHTIPYKAQKPSGKLPEKFTVKVHPKLTTGVAGDLEFRIVKVEGNKVTISRHAGSEYGPTMPKESLKHFIHDLEGRVELPPSGNPDIDAVTQGKAGFLGKGDDGLVFRVGGQVVKVSTTVPYQPENPGHRTPEQAKAMLRGQVEMGNRLADLGIKGIQRSKYVAHGDKGFQIKAYVELPEKFTRDQLDAVQDTLIEIHKAGYSINDAIQAGLVGGKPVMFDVGKADKIPAGEDPTSMYSRVSDDMAAMRRLYKEHGQEFVRRDYSEGLRAVERVKEKFDGWLSKNPGFAHKQAKMAIEKRAAELRITLSGKDLDAALEDLDLDFWVERAELEDAGFVLPSVGAEAAAEKSLVKSYSGAQYTRMKAVLKQRGHTDADFEPKGRLYGRPVDTLMGMINATN